MNEPGITVMSKDHRLVRREDGVELAVGKPMRVLRVGLETHEIDDVYEADLEFREVLP